MCNKVSLAVPTPLGLRPRPVPHLVKLSAERPSRDSAGARHRRLSRDGRHVGALPQTRFHVLAERYEGRNEGFIARRGHREG